MTNDVKHLSCAYGVSSLEIHGDMSVWIHCPFFYLVGIVGNYEHSVKGLLNVSAKLFCRVSSTKSYSKKKKKKSNNSNNLYN